MDDISDEELRELFPPKSSDSVPWEDELDYLYTRQRQLEVIVILMTLLHIIYFVRRLRGDDTHG